MTDAIRVALLAIAGVLIAVVFELVRRRKLAEEYSFLWIAVALLLLAVSARRHALDTLAAAMGIGYPPVLLVALLVGVLFVSSLWFSVIVSRQRRQIERLIEETSILSAEIDQLRAERTQDARRGAPKRPAV